MNENNIFNKQFDTNKAQNAKGNCKNYLNRPFFKPSTF